MNSLSSPHKNLLTILSRRISSVLHHLTKNRLRNIEKNDTIRDSPNITDVDCAEDTDIIAELARAEIDCGLATQPKTTHTNTMSRLTQRIPEGQLIFFLYR